MYFKNFDQWNFVKQKINKRINAQRLCAGTIYWAVIGINIGHEIDGKDGSFTRPVLVVHVVGNYLALVVPCSTKIKFLVGCLPLIFKGKHMSLCVHQMRIISQQRILARFGRISASHLLAG